MTRFILTATVWMLASFAGLWWVQTGVDGMHRHAAEAIGRAVQFDPAPGVAADDEAARALATALQQRNATPEDLARLEFDRRELMRRLRVLWISLTLAPVLIGAWWALRPPLAVSRSPEHLNPPGV